MSEIFSGSGTTKDVTKFTINQLISSAEKRWADSVALCSTQQRLTFAELGARSSQLARVLARHSVRKGDRVALLAGRSIEAIVALAAILKAGACYLPLEPAHGRDALDFVLGDATPALVLLGPGVDAADGLPCLRLQDALAAAESESPAPPDIAVQPCDPAYVMYTSGSTGRAKGVVVPHQAVARLVHGADFMTLSPATVMLHAAPLAFDASTLEIWGPLANGGRVAVMTDAVPSIDRIAATIRDLGVNAAWLTAGLFHLMIEQRPDALSPLSQLLAGGDVLSPAHLRKALALLPGCRIINGYGPTENTTFTCCYAIPREGWGAGAVPIGHPIAGTTVHILSETLEPVADGEEGQLCAGGAGVALGYLNRPELTAERFVADPFSTEPGARLYLTGDYARRRQDGAIEFLGRRDRQIKIDGLRVELDGIEQALREDPRLGDAAVALAAAEGATKRIVAFLKPAAWPAPHDLGGAVLAGLRRRFPPQMIPAAVVVAELPLNANGKIDRARLLAEHAAASTPANGKGADAAGPGSQVADIWRDILQRPVDVRANLFDLGATSLQMIAAHACIQAATGVSFPVTELFAHPSIAALEAFLAGARSASGRAAAAGHGQRQRAAMQAMARGRSRGAFQPSAE